MLYSTLEELTYEELEQYTYEQLESIPFSTDLSSEQKKVYMVEIFKPNFDYRSSTQVSDIEIEIDYLSITKNKIQMVEIEAVTGDYIRISTSEDEIDGVLKGSDIWVDGQGWMDRAHTRARYFQAKFEKMQREANKAAKPARKKLSKIVASKEIEVDAGSKQE